MAGKTNIEWTGHTWNPLAGCSVVTPGCKRCYAMRLAKRLGAMGNPLYAGLTQDTNGGAVWTGEMRKAPRHTLLEPLRRKKPTVYFVNSMSDLFHENVPDEWIDEIFATMALSADIGHHHTYQILTKRADRMRCYIESKIAKAPQYVDIPEMWAKVLLPYEGGIPRNIWLGVSTEDQTRADERIPELLATPAAIRFISAEPLLAPIDLENIDFRAAKHGGVASAIAWADDQPRVDWVIVGGESGGGYRPMAPEWAYSLRDQCVAAGVPVFIKQMAGKKPIPDDLVRREFPVAA